VRPPIPTIAAGGTAAGRPIDKEPSMFNLALALIPSPGPDERRDAEEEGFLGKLVLRARRQIRYRRALDELHRLDDRDLADLDLARGDFPELAWRHATGAEPLGWPRRGS
jgi:uncharacterized protein YjiS (DUF1127 family)